MPLLFGRPSPPFRTNSVVSPSIRRLLLLLLLPAAFQKDNVE
jgi:hypothetical protein